MHTKVFVGNLSFKTKADELAAEFSAAGRVVSANIITRGPRSLGYGFVELENEEDARKAVTVLNKRTVDGREINVEIAKPRDEAKVAEQRAAREANRGRGGRRGGGRGGRAPRSDAPAQSGAPAAEGGNVASNNNNSAPSRGRRGPRRGGRGGGAPRSDAPRSDAPANTTGGDNKAPRARRPRRQPRNLTNRAQSPTTLFVANLPFVLDDAGLQTLFKDQKVVKAHVVKNRNGRSKGFGFVEFANQGDQSAALAASGNLVSETRPLIVKIALTPPENTNAGSAAPSDSKEAVKDNKAAEGAKST